MLVVNLCSNSRGSFSPMPDVWCNIFSFGETYHLIFKEDKYNICLGESNIESYLRNYAETSQLCLHIMYEPGRIYPEINYRIFDRVILRIGDIHHLSNPLTQCYLYIKSLEINKIYFNTTPHWCPLFQILGFNVKFWSDLSESARFSHKNISSNILAKVRAPVKVGYIGHLLSRAHCRRSWFINSILSYGVDVVLYPFGNHNQWFENIDKLHYILCPSLNGQLSHNLFTPCFIGSVVITDTLAHPSPLTSSNSRLPILEFGTPESIFKFLSLSNYEKYEVWSSYFVHRTKETLQALSAIDSGFNSYQVGNPYHSLINIDDNARNEITFLVPDSMTLVSEHLTPLLLLNLVEIIQEFHRLTKNYIYITCSSAPLLKIFHNVLLLPRIYIGFEKPNLNSRVNIFKLELCNEHKFQYYFQWTYPSDILSDKLSSNIINIALFKGLDFGSYHCYPQRLHACLELIAQPL